MRNIPHSPEMIKAFAEGRKTETRRTRGLNQINENPGNWTAGVCSGKEFKDKPTTILFQRTDGHWKQIKYPYGKAGDIVYLGEGIYNKRDYAAYYTFIQDSPYDYVSNNVTNRNIKWTWKTNHISSVYMPAVAARNFARIKSVRVERLHDISREAAIAEGIEKTENGFLNYMDGTTMIDPILSYFSLWDKINGANSHEQNPWLWVTEYEPVTKEEALALPKCKYCKQPGVYFLALLSKNQKRITSRDIIPVMICAEHMVDALIQLNDSCFGSRCFPAVLDANKKLLMKTYKMPTRDILSAWEEVQQGLNKAAK